jgi:hypothetical protein
MDLDNRELEKVVDKVVNNSEVINKIIDKIEDRYAHDLDNFMLGIENILKGNRELNDKEIEEIILKIPVYLYFAVQGLEVLGVESDMAKAVKAEVFAEVFLKSDGTIPDKTKAAEMITQKEQMIEVAFARAYRKLKTMIDKAELLFSGVNKIYQKRIIEFNIKMKEKYYNVKVGMDNDKF